MEQSKNFNSECYTFDNENNKEFSGCSQKKESIVDRKKTAVEISLNDKFMQQNIENHVISERQLHGSSAGIIKSQESCLQEQNPETEKKNENSFKDQLQENIKLNAKLLKKNSLGDNESHIQFASPLFVCHEYSVSENSSRTETQESDSCETPRLELNDNSVTIESVEMGCTKDLETFESCNKLCNQKLSTCTTLEKNIGNTDSDSYMISKDIVNTKTDSLTTQDRKWCIEQFMSVNEVASENSTDVYQNVNEMVSQNQTDFQHVNEIVSQNPFGNLKKSLIPVGSRTTNINDTAMCVNISTEEDKIISEVRDILEYLIIKCEHECRNPETLATFDLDVESFTPKDFGHICFQKGGEIEPFSNRTEKEISLEITEDITKFDIDDLDIIVSFQSVPQQATGITENMGNVSSIGKSSSAEGCSLIVVEHLDERSDTLNFETVNSKFERNFVEDYKTKAQILKRENSEKLHLLLSPQCTENNSNNEISENIIQYSQNSTEEVQSDSEFEIFDSEEESIASETEMQESHVEEEKSKLHDSCCDKTNEKPYIDENLEPKSDKLTNKQNISPESRNTNDADLIETANRNLGYLHRISYVDMSQSEYIEHNVEHKFQESESLNKNQELLEKKTIQKVSENYSANASFNLDHEPRLHLRAVNDNLIGHLEPTQNNLSEKPYGSSKNKISSDLICNVKEEDIPCIQTSANVSKTNNLDEHQENNANIYMLSKSGNQLLEFNLSYERNESELFNKQLTAENMHRSAETDYAKLQEMENTCIYQNKEKFIKVRQNHLSFNNQGNNFSNGRSERKRSIERDNVDDEAPPSKVSAVNIGNNMQEKLQVLRHDIRCTDKEQKENERQCMNTTEKFCLAVDQAVPDISAAEKIDNVPETLYIPEMDIKKHRLKIDNDERRMETDINEKTVSVFENQGSSAITSDVKSGNPIQSFKWKYVPSVDLDSVVPNIDEDEKNDKPVMPVPLQTCRKPYRLGLSKKQKLPSLHPMLKKI